jgi:Predicted membrane protein (DUF2207) N-terminal domain/Predicted membrane protein (DUF2207) C-terminal domain
MPRAVKSLLQFIVGLAIMAAFMYPRMAPMIRRSRAMKKAQLSARPAGQGTVKSKSQFAPLDRITSFASDVTLRKDATLEVREEFVVHSEGDYFRYGMVRDLPIDSEARWDRRLVGEYTKDTGIRVKILEVTEDGAPVSYEQGSDASYEQVRIVPWQPLAPGDHRFVVRYEADGVTQFLPDKDQLYWNAVGHYWRLTVDEAVVRVHLPPEVPAGVVTVQAYAGGRGANLETVGRRGKQVEPSAIADGFEFRIADLPWAGSLSVSLTWPKGFLMPPALGPLAHDGWLLIAPTLLLLYYTVVWFALGRQPKRGTIAIQYQPPQGLSPAAMRYIRTTGCDGRTLAATIAQLAVRGCLGIESIGGKYKLTKLTDIDPKALQPQLAAEELDLLGTLFEDGPTVVLDPRNGGPLTRYSYSIYQELHIASGNLYFTRNARWLVLGTFASFLTAIGMALTAHGRSTDLMPLLFLTWWFFFCFFLLGLIAVMTILPAWGRMMRGLGGAKQVLMGSAAIAVFGVAGGFVLWQLKSAASLAYAFSLLALVAINIVAFPALKRLTPRGRQMLDQIEGFRLFLQKVEQDRMQRLTAADPHSAASSEFMPYAIALDLREAWGDHLAEACVATTTTR